MILRRAVARVRKKTKTEYSTNGWFIVKREQQTGVFLHNYDPHLKPNSDCSSKNSDCTHVDNNDNAGADYEDRDADDSDGPQTAKNQRRGSGDFWTAHHKMFKIIVHTNTICSKII